MNPLPRSVILGNIAAETKFNFHQTGTGLLIYCLYEGLYSGKAKCC